MVAPTDAPATTPTRNVISRPTASTTRDRGEGREQVAAAALAAGDGRLERPPRPLGAGDRGPVDHAEQPAQPEHEGEDVVVGAGEGDQQQRVAAAVAGGAGPRLAVAPPRGRSAPAGRPAARRSGTSPAAVASFRRPERNSLMTRVPVVASPPAPVDRGERPVRITGRGRPGQRAGTAPRGRSPGSGRRPRCRRRRSPGSPRPTLRRDLDRDPAGLAAVEGATWPDPSARPSSRGGRRDLGGLDPHAHDPFGGEQLLHRSPRAPAGPAAMIPTTSAICWTSARRWLETKTVLPIEARCRSVSRMATIPAGSRPLAGSSRSSSFGSLSSAPAIPSRCFIPSE